MLRREPVEPEKRKPFREFDIATRFNQQEGRCALCPILIQFDGGPPSVLGASFFHADHILPRDLGGKTNLANLQLLCIRCHDEKTTQSDRPMIDKARRIRKREADGPRPSKMASRGFDKRLRRRLDGSVVPR